MPSDPQIRAPQGLIDYLKNTPFLGRLTCSHSELVAGETTELVLDYHVGAAGMADGGWLKITFKFYSDWALFQTLDPKQRDYVSAEYLPRQPFPGESPATVKELRVRFDQQGHERPYQKAVIVDAIDGYVNAGDVLRIRLGDRRQGAPGTRVQTFIEDSFRFRAYVDTAGTSRYAEVPGDTIIRIRSGPPSALKIIAPRLARTGEAVSVRVRAEDAWGNVCSDLGGPIRVSAAGISASGEFPSNGWAAIRAELPALVAGAHVIEASGAGLAAQAPLTVDVPDAVPRHAFADLHVHSHDTVGTNSTRYNLLYARDVAGLDVVGYTVNDFQIRERDWAEAVAICGELDRAGEFVCYPGTEWCGASAAGGDRNVIFLGDTVRFPLDRNGKSVRSFEWHEGLQTRQVTPGAWPISGVFDAYADLAAQDEVLMVPHVGGRRANLDWHHAGLERLVEIASSWGHFDEFYRDALKRGLKVGASAAGDEHRGRPGGGHPGAAVFGVLGGITGVLAPSLDRPSVAKALRTRHTWATTGQRSVALLSAGAHRQGDEFRHRGPLEVRYRLLGQTAWEFIGIGDGESWIVERNLHAEAGFAPNRVRIRWGGARIKDRYRWAAWRGTISVEGSSIVSLSPFGQEHPEETIRRIDAQTIEVRTETFGDADGLELELSDLRGARIRVDLEIHRFIKTASPLLPQPFPDCPRVELNVSGSELLERSSIRKELGGVDLFVAVERASGDALPLDVAGSAVIPPQNGAHGFRPIYLFARSRNDEKVWTSPLFATFED